MNDLDHLRIIHGFSRRDLLKGAAASAMLVAAGCKGGGSSDGSSSGGSTPPPPPVGSTLEVVVTGVGNVNSLLNNTVSTRGSGFSEHYALVDGPADAPASVETLLNHENRYTDEGVRQNAVSDLGGAVKLYNIRVFEAGKSLNGTSNGVNDLVPLAGHDVTVYLGKDRKDFTKFELKTNVTGHVLIANDKASNYEFDTILIEAFANNGTHKEVLEYELDHSKDGADIEVGLTKIDTPSTILKAIYTVEEKTTWGLKGLRRQRDYNKSVKEGKRFRQQHEPDEIELIFDRDC